MATPITTGNFPKALWPGVNAWFGKDMQEHRTEYTDLFDVSTSSKGWEEDVGQTGFGLLRRKSQGSGVEFDTARQSYVTRYVHDEYALGFIITRVMMEDNQYMQAGETKAKGLAFSTNQTIETLGANVFNRAFSTSYLGGDGKELCATDHPLWGSGGTYANELTTAADLSEAALEQAVIDISRWTDDRGLKIAVMPQSLHIPPELIFEAERILMSPGRVATADNDLNALKAMGKFPKGIKVNHYFTDTDAWFIRTNVPNGLKWFWRRRPEFTQDNDWDTENAKFKVTMRASQGWTNPRAAFGSPGA